jgi:hypothetical protein
MLRMAEAGPIAHQAAGQDELTTWKGRWQRMAGCERYELFRALAEEATVGDQDRTNALLGKTCEGHFEIAIGSGINNNELQAQHARRRLQVCDLGLDIREGRVRENAKQCSIG